MNADLFLFTLYVLSLALVFCALGAVAEWMSGS